MSEGKPDTFEFFPDREEQGRWSKHPGDKITLVPGGTEAQREHAEPFKSVYGTPQESPDGKVLGGPVVVDKDRLTEPSRARLGDWWEETMRGGEEQRPDPAQSPSSNAAASRPATGPYGIPVGPNERPGQGGQLPGLKIPQGVK